jgi:hypothetical protein
MSKMIGRYYTFDWKTVKVGAIKSISMSIDGNNVDVSDHDSGRWTDYLTGRVNATFDITCNRKRADPAQGTITTDMLATDRSGAFSFEPSGTPATGDITFGGTGLLSNVSMTVGDDDVVEISFSLQVSGELTKTTTGP